MRPRRVRGRARRRRRNACDRGECWRCIVSQRGAVSARRQHRAAGTFAATLTGVARLEVMTSPGVSTLVLRHTGIARGDYNPATGAWTGAGQRRRGRAVHQRPAVRLDPSHPCHQWVQRDRRHQTLDRSYSGIFPVDRRCRSDSLRERRIRRAIRKWMMYRSPSPAYFRRAPLHRQRRRSIR